MTTIIAIAFIVCSAIDIAVNVWSARSRARHVLDLRAINESASQRNREFIAQCEKNAENMRAIMSGSALPTRHGEARAS